MRTDKVAFEGVLWGGATGSHMTGSDVNHVPCPEVCSAHAQTEVVQYPPKWGLFDRKWQSRDRKWSCPAFSRAFFLVVVPWLPDVTEGHLTPFGVPWVCATGSCATPVVVVNNVGWECSLWRLRPIIIGNPRVLYLVTGTRPGYLPLLFSYSVKVV